ncbi:MAG: nuclear transport factor 2 family protein [Chloroflexota bacterium]|nr:MAG: nuclear transport factor 2 family protein [Chloroflexota bacterium]
MNKKEPTMTDEPPAIQPQPKKSRTILWIVLAVSIVGTCLCTIVCVAPFIVAGAKVAAERAPVESVLNDYMRYMAAKDVDSAFALFSPHMQEQTPVEYMQYLVAEGNDAMFSGFQSLTVDSLRLGSETSTDPTQPQGVTAYVSGTISYSGGFTGQYVAILEKVDGAWKIYSVTVTVPQNK